MIKIIKENVLFFFCFAIFLVLGGIFLSQIEKGDAIFYFSDRRSFGGDLFFKYCTKVGEHYTYLICLIAMLFVRYRFALLFPIIGLFVTIMSKGLKTYYGRPRPIRFFENEGIADTLNVIEGIQLHGAYTSFPSGHTMSGFALFTLVALIVKRKKGIAFLLFLTAFLVGLSRVYLIQHFFEDIYLGAICGVSLALCLYYLQDKIKLDTNRRIDQYIGFEKTQKPVV